MKIEEAEAEEVAEEAEGTKSPESSRSQRDKTQSRLSKRLKKTSPRYEREDFFEVLIGSIHGYQWSRSEPPS